MYTLFLTHRGQMEDQTIRDKTLWWLFYIFSWQNKPKKYYCGLFAAAFAEIQKIWIAELQEAVSCGFCRKLSNCCFTQTPHLILVQKIISQKCNHIFFFKILNAFQAHHKHLIRKGNISNILEVCKPDHSCLLKENNLFFFLLSLRNQDRKGQFQCKTTILE